MTHNTPEKSKLGDGLIHVTSTNSHAHLSTDQGSSRYSNILIQRDPILEKDEKARESHTTQTEKDDEYKSPGFG